MMKKKTRIALVSMCSETGNVQANLARHEYWIKKVRNNKPDFIGFPEFSLTGWIYNGALSLKSKWIKAFEQLAVKHGIFLGAGFVEKRGAKMHNTCIIAGPKGRVGVMRKVNLTPPEATKYTPGREFPVFELDGFTVGVATCADATCYEMIHLLSLRGADVIFAPHANTLGKYGGTPRGWIKWRKERWPLFANDASVYIAGINNARFYEDGSGNEQKAYCGGGMVMDFTGKIVSSINLKTPKEAVIVQELDLANMRKTRSEYSLIKHFQAATVYNRKESFFHKKSVSSQKSL